MQRLQRCELASNLYNVNIQLSPHVVNPLQAQSALKFDTMLLPLIDPNPYLSDGSKQVCLQASALDLSMQSV